MGDGPAQDFFISYTRADEAWARWIAVELERAGYTTVSQVLDFRPGSDFVHAMQRATIDAVRTIAVLSRDYFSSSFGEAEWRIAFARDPSGEKRLLVPVMVAPCDPPGLLLTRVYIDVSDADETTARQLLLDGVGPAQPRPTHAAFPGRTAEPFPGAGPAVNNLPARNRNFAGRAALLDDLQRRLRDGAVATVLPVEAVHGLGGVGKTELVTEYAHRNSRDYDVVWWVPAEQAITAAAALAALARRLGVPVAADQTAMIDELFVRLRHRDRWLLIYDNAEQPHTLDGLLPLGGVGHILVTSRWSAWSRYAEPLRLDVLDRSESIQFLIRRTGITDEDGLGELAELVGDLPLALDEAAGYLEATGIGIGDYLRLVRERARELFALAPDDDADQRRVATVWSVSLESVRERAPAAGALLALCAFLGPDIPRDLPTAHADTLPQPLAVAVTDPLLYNRTLEVLGKYSLVEASPSTVSLHRLVQEVVRASLDPTDERNWAGAAVALLRNAFPDDSEEVKRWPRCASLLPHLVAAAGHAERLGIAGKESGWLLRRASAYLRERGQYPQALALARRAVDASTETLGSDHIEIAWRRDELGQVLHELGDLTNARIEYEHALRITENALGPDHPEVGIRRGNLGNVLRDLGDLTAALSQYELALRIGANALGPDHPDVGTHRNNLGMALYSMGDLTDARTQFEQAIDVGQSALGPNHPDVGVYHGNLGNVLRDLGQLSAARTQLEQALQISEAAVGADHPDNGIWRNNLATVLDAMGDITGAVSQLERALHISESSLGPDHPTIGIRRINLGTMLRKLGDLTGARIHLEQALLISEEALGPDHPQTRKARAALDLLGG